MDGEGSAPHIKVPADLLDSAMLYQRDAVLHAGMAEPGPLPRAARRVLHALVSAAEGEVIAADASLGACALRAGMATLVVRRAVEDVGAPRLVVVGPGSAELAPLPREGASGVGRRWVSGSDAGAPAARAFTSAAAAYLGRDAARLDLRSARMGLRGRLDRINSARMILVNVVASGADERAVGLQVGRLAELCGFGEAEEERLLAASSSLERVDEALDAIRAFELWLAVHVFECAWLEAAARGEEVPAFRLVETLEVGDLPASCLEEDRIDLLGVVSAQDVPAGAVRPLVRSAGRSVVTGDLASASEGSALAEGLAGCRWDFSPARGER